MHLTLNSLCFPSLLLWFSVAAPHTSWGWAGLQMVSTWFQLTPWIIPGPQLRSSNVTAGKPTWILWVIEKLLLWWLVLTQIIHISQKSMDWNLHRGFYCSICFCLDVIEWFMNSSPSLCRSSILRSLRKNRRMAAHPNPAARTAAVLWVVRTAHSLYGYETSHYHPLFLPFISHTFMNNIRVCLICEKLRETNKIL